MDAMVQQRNGNSSKTGGNDEIVRSDVSAIGYLLGSRDGVMLKGGAGHKKGVACGAWSRRQRKRAGRCEAAQGYFRRLSTRFLDALSVQSWYPISLERMIP